MEPVDPKELLEVLASAQAQVKTPVAQGGSGPAQGYDPTVTYRSELADAQKQAQQHGKPLRAHYIFSLPTWDVIELLTDRTVQTFTQELSHGKMKLQAEGKSTYHPIQPVVRYLLLVPGSPETEGRQEALRLMDQPFIDHLVVVTAVLVDDGLYVPAGAHYIGKRPGVGAPHGFTEGKNHVRQAIYQALDGLTRELDLSQIKRAPDLPSDILRLITIFRERELTPPERADMVRGLSALDDLQLIEVVNRVLPTAWNLNQWFPTEPSIANRLYEYKQAHPDLKGKMRNAPYKTAIMHPVPYEPIIVFEMSGEYDRWQQRVRPSYEREPLTLS
jgi:hypothetical protein